MAHHLWKRMRAAVRLPQRAVMLLALMLLWGVSPTLQAATILVFGDSISAAYGLEVKQGWVSLLQQKLDKTAPGKHVVVNGSLSGETTSGGRTRLPMLLQKHRPDVVIIELGGNDGLRGQSPALMAGNLRQMIADAKAAKANVILLGMKIPPNYGKAYTQAFEKVFVTVSAETKVPLLPFFLEGVGGRPELVQADGIHPVAAAQPRLLENAWPLIAAALKSR